MTKRGKTGNRIVQLTLSAVAMAVSAALFAPNPVTLAATPIQLASNFETLANSDLLLSGPIDRVDAKSFQITVLGQTVDLPAAQHQLANTELVGQMVSAYGSVTTNGALKVTRVNLATSTEYVPGSTQ